MLLFDISSTEMCLWFHCIFVHYLFELFVCQSSKRGKLLDYLSKQSLLLVVLMVTNKHNYELIISASPMKYSGSNRDVNTLKAIASWRRNHWVIGRDILGIGTRKSNTHGVHILLELSTNMQWVHLKKDMTWRRQGRTWPDEVSWRIYLGTWRWRP